MLTNLFPVTLRNSLETTFKTPFRSLPCTAVLLRLFDSNNEPDSVLSSRELKQLREYKLPKRRYEYLTGRVCAKMAVKLQFASTPFASVTMAQIEIINTDHGRPLVEVHAATSALPLDVSISHSKEYAVAIASKYRCGIDIQSKEKSLLKVKEKFSTNEERIILAKMLPKEDELSQLAILWSAKEAIQKNLSATIMPVFSDIILQDCQVDHGNSAILSFSIQPGKNKWSARDITVTAGTFKNYAIAISASGEKS